MPQKSDTDSVLAHYIEFANNYFTRACEFFYNY